MRLFNKVVSVDRDMFPQNITDEIGKLSKSAEFYPSKPKTEEETIERIGDADCVLLTWQTKISKKVLESCTCIKYIGLIGKTPNIDIEEAKKRGIVITNITQHGHEAVPEFIFACLLSLAKGFGKNMWKHQPSELSGKTIGIIGMGFSGTEFAKYSLKFSMNVIYYSKTRKPEIESLGVKYSTLKEVLENSDIISLHTPANTIILCKRELDMLKENSILVDTCLGGSIDQEYFISLINKKRIFGVFDLTTGEEFYNKTRHLNNIFFPRLVAGRTIESSCMIGEKIIENMKSFLSDPSCSP
jgi:hypothetical protein